MSVQICVAMVFGMLKLFDLYRYFKLDPSLKFIEVRLPSDSRVEQIIDIKDIIKTSLPHTTVDIIKFQKNDGYHSQELNKSNDKSCIDYSIFHVNGNISNLVNAGIINKNSQLYRQK